MSSRIRKYSVRRDKKATQRIWQECGWISDEKRELEAFDIFMDAGNVWVYELDGSAEGLVHSTPAHLLHTRTELRLAAITAVNTSRVARNLGAASATLAQAIAEEAANGAQLTGLGIFEQGFYDRLGYGNGTYEHWVSFDPAWLVDLGKPRTPERLSSDDWREVHESRLKRYKLHGAVDLLPPGITRGDMKFEKNSFGLGYREDGEITHHFQAHAENVSRGPYTIDWMSYQNLDQLRELLALIRGLGDQVRVVKIHEPKHIQLQSLLRKPFQLYNITADTKNASRALAYAYWQIRILDLQACVGAISIADSLEFNLRLSDPIGVLLPDDAPWRGLDGEYSVSLGTRSSAVPGAREGLPILEASVNDLSRFWIGSARADTLAALGTFRADKELIAALDESVHLPNPEPDWDY